MPIHDVYNNYKSEMVIWNQKNQADQLGNDQVNSKTHKGNEGYSIQGCYQCSFTEKQFHDTPGSLNLWHATTAFKKLVLGLTIWYPT